MTMIDKAEALALIAAYAEKIFDAPIYHYHSETTGKPEPIGFAEFGLSVDIHDAKALGVHTTYSDRWHGISDIRRDEVRDTEIAVMRKALAPLLDAIAALPARGVKPLVWENGAAKDLYGDEYQVVLHEGGTYEIEHPRLFNSWHRFPTIDAAKAAAQADYEARILAALDHAALTPNPVGDSQTPDPAVNAPLIATRPLTDEEAAAIRAEVPGRCYPAPTEAAQARSHCPYGATGDDCCGGYCDMDDDQKGGDACDKDDDPANARPATSPGVTAGAVRADEMLRIAARYIRDHCPDGMIHYDDADCDGSCVADDCEVAADVLIGEART